MADLVDLKISEREIERLSGCDVGEIFIGGVFGGVWRSSVLQDPKRLTALCLTQVVVFFLIAVFALPFVLFITPNSTHGISQGSSILQFSGVTFGIAFVALVAWNGWMWLQSRRYQGLMHLLDEIDRFHQVIGAIVLLDQLNSVSLSEASALQNRAEIVEALRVTRDSLVAGLMTERILRESRGVLARRQDLLASIETNLATLRYLEIQHQADDYGQFLNEALQINLSVHHEMQKLNKTRN